ncbi:TrkA family potassium uptake protein [Shewanella sp. NIFS-20-20]|uniref:potassium channel family protein n=1 Tax=Shewanella sp. NIFS-20-20 TaxID=2853806 RepID=UPI001C43B615|nr:TrkA family potassium uptake protein [Shewanella sp. NIFS-20-20]MBV7316639.1 TrkA family potassium uptake protein [Shewanella sp. NIFS-20-20]
MATNNKQFAIIGLGRFGIALCTELVEHGAQVLAIDIKEELVEKVADLVNQAVIADCTTEDAIRELRLSDYDLVVVAIGAQVNNSILATLLLKELGVAKVWVKANDKFHARIIEKIGADKIILPEREIGIKVARSMLDDRVFDFLDIGDDMALTEWVIGPQNAGNLLGELALFQQENIQILAVKQGARINSCPEPDTLLQSGDIVILVGDKDELTAKLRSI